MAEKWIQGAIKHPGALHKQLGVPQGKKIPGSMLSKAVAKGGTLGKRARLAETLSHMHHGHHSPTHHHESEGDGHHASTHHGAHVNHTVNLHLHVGGGKKKFTL